MKRHEAFPGQYLRADDIGTARPTVTISHVTMEKFGDDTKPVLHFTGKDKGMAVNATVWASLEEITGEEDSDNWAGHRVTLYVDPNVMYQGKRVKGLRVCAPPAGKNGSKPAPPPEPEPEVADYDDTAF